MESANRTRNLELVRSDARFEQEEKPIKFDSDDFFEHLDAMEDMLREIESFMADCVLLEDVETFLMDHKATLEYEINRLRG